MGIIIDIRLSFEEHLELVFSKINKAIGLIPNFNALYQDPQQKLLSGFILIIGDIIYEQAYNSPIHWKTESVQYNACLPITEAIRRTSKEKLYYPLTPPLVQKVILLLQVLQK